MTKFTLTLHRVELNSYSSPHFTRFQLSYLKLTYSYNQDTN